MGQYLCDKCGYFTTNKIRFLQHMEQHRRGILPEVKNKPIALEIPKDTITTIKSDSINKKREELELLRLEADIEKIKKPDTSVDYYAKMLEIQEKQAKQQLEMQEKHYTSMMQMQNQQMNLQLELEKLKLGSGDDMGDDFLKQLLPILPTLIKKRAEQKQSEGQTTAPPAKIEKEAERVKKPTKAQLEEYKLKIRVGEISLEQFAKDAREHYAIARAASDEQIKEQYDKIKNAM